MSECAGCNAMDMAPVILSTGAVVCSKCPAWADECLARFRHVEAMRTLGREGRARYLNRVQLAEGEESASRLKAAFVRDWEARKAMEGAA